jgi:TRAP-type C4-dicarboxylate transport system permease large subunit
VNVGLIHPPVGLNRFGIRNIAPDISLKQLIYGTLPFGVLMIAVGVRLPTRHICRTSSWVRPAHARDRS